MNARSVNAKTSALAAPNIEPISPLRPLSRTQRNKALNIRKDWFRFTREVHLGMIDKI